MKRLIIMATTALALTACATGPSAYGPASGGSLGFENTQIEKDRFRIAYTGRSEAEAPISSRIGIGIGSGGGYGFGRGRTRTNVNLGIGIHDVARALEGSKVTESIEVVLKRSGSGDDPAVYDARSVQESIRPQNFQ